MCFLLWSIPFQIYIITSNIPTLIDTHAHLDKDVFVIVCKQPKGIPCLGHLSE